MPILFMNKNIWCYWNSEVAINQYIMCGLHFIWFWCNVSPVSENVKKNTDISRYWEWVQYICTIPYHTLNKISFQQFNFKMIQKRHNYIIYMSKIKIKLYVSEHGCTMHILFIFPHPKLSTLISNILDDIHIIVQNAARFCAQTFTHIYTHLY